MNCAAIPATLLESELFGHEKGSLIRERSRKTSGALNWRIKGRCSSTKSVRFRWNFSRNCCERFRNRSSSAWAATGPSTSTSGLSPRPIAISGKWSIREVPQRPVLSSERLPLAVPPLRERREDIPLLARFFVQKYAGKLNRTIKRISSTTLEALSRYEWPGNVRELQNVIERAVILCNHETLSIHETWMPNRASEAIRIGGALRTNLATHEREIIEAALRHSRGRISGPSGAAVKLGLPRSTLESRMESLGIDNSAFKARIAFQSSGIGHPLF